APLGRREPRQSGVTAISVVIRLVGFQLVLKIALAPEQCLIEKLSPYGPYQSLNESMRTRGIRNSLDLVHFEYPKVRQPATISVRVLCHFLPSSFQHLIYHSAPFNRFWVLLRSRLVSPKSFWFANCDLACSQRFEKRKIISLGSLLWHSSLHHRSIVLCAPAK